MVAAAVIIWTLWLWTQVIIRNGSIITVETSTEVDQVTLMILGMLNGITGFATKYLWDSSQTD